MLVQVKVNCTLPSTLLCLSVETLAPPVKQTASFKIKDAKCHLHPKLTGRAEDRGRALGPGKELAVSLCFNNCYVFMVVSHEDRSHFNRLKSLLTHE